MIIVALVLLIIVLLFSFVPTYVARYLVTNTLHDFDIELEGLKTLKINLWKREVWAGPVRFRTGNTDQGQLGEIGIKINVFPFLQKHAMIERVLIRGVDIFITRAEDNTLTLNGIPLNQFSPAVDTAEPKQVAKQSKPWGAGLGEFELQDSRILFKEKTGGMLTVKIERLRLGDFTSWLPDAPGTFQLQASVNDIKLDLNGQARPFAKHITLNVDTDARDAELPKVIEFTGPLFGLERNAGVHRSKLHHEITLFDTGRIEGHTKGNIAVHGADYAQVERFSIALEEGSLDLDTRYSLSKKDDFKVNGKLTLGLRNANGKLPGNNTFAIGTARVDLVNLNALHDKNNNLIITASSQLDLEQAAYSGRVQLSMDALLDVLRYLQSISTNKNITPEQTGLGQWSGDEVILPKSDINVKHLNNTVSKFEMNTSNGTVKLALATIIKSSGLTVDTNERKAKIDTTQAKINTLQLHSGNGQTGLKLAGDYAVTGFQIKSPVGKALINTVDLKQDIDLKINQGDITLQGSAKAAVGDTQLKVNKTDALPAANFGVAAVNANIKKAHFSLIKQKMKWQVEAGTKVDGASANYAKGKISSANIKQLDWQGARMDHHFNFATRSLIISGLDATVTRQFIDGLTQTKPVDSSAKDKNKQDDEDQSETGTADPTLIKSKTSEPTTANSERTDNLKPHLKIERVELANGAQLHFLDNNVQPPVKVHLDIQSAEVKDIDSRNIEKNAHASLRANINEFTRIEINGRATNPGPKLDMAIKATLENLELSPYSSYAAEFGGVNLESGQLNTGVNVNAKKGELDGAIKLNIKNLEFTPLSEADAQRLSETTGVPIQTAVQLLRDKDRTINLALPITGTVVAPNIDISSAISKAIGNTLKAVFPPTLIGSILSSVKQDGKLTFKPVLFKPGSTELDTPARNYLDELATLLTEHPTLYLKICGRSTPEDFKEVTLISIQLPDKPKPEAIEGRQRLLKTHGPKLTALATERTQVVRRFLIKDKGLTARQVGECRPVFNPNDTEPPRVAVTL